MMIVITENIKTGTVTLWVMWVYTEWLGLLLSPAIRVFWLGGWVEISAFVVLWLLLIN